MKWIVDQTQKEGYVLVSWIHSHVGGTLCGFSSVDMHTQYRWEQAFPAVLGTVLQINGNNYCDGSSLREALASRRACMAVSELLKSAPFCALIILKLRTFTTFFVLLMSGNNPESELYICLKSIRDKFVYRAAKRRNSNFVCNHLCPVKCL